MEGHAPAPVSDPLMEGHGEAPVSDPLREGHGEAPVSDPLMEGHGEAPVFDPLMEGHGEAPVSDPLMESHAEGDKPTSDPNFLDSLPFPPHHQKFPESMERLLLIGRLSLSSSKPNPKGPAPKPPGSLHSYPRKLRNSRELPCRSSRQGLFLKSLGSSQGTVCSHTQQYLS